MKTNQKLKHISFRKNNFIKKFVLTFNINKNLLYDEMYEGTSIQNLFLKDKKIFTCSND